MNTKKRVVSATELENNTVEILNIVYYGKETVAIERHGKSVAEIVPPPKDFESNSDIKKRFDSLFGAIPDFPEVHKDRSSRKR